MSTRRRIETWEIAEGLDVDLDAWGNIVGLDIDRGSSELNLTTPEIVAPPIGWKRDA